ncbi:site-specific integrase [Photobacterium minamisatsumaniensis]|uniref:site-specific integrase n=1 Tax=Photobacterium minamisatsumaniensis TaxID=2910233 RepID=UPI00124AABDF
MKESTRLEYVRLGAHFVKTVQEESELGHIPPSEYLNALKERSGSTTPAYWRRLKTAYAEWCFAEGYAKQGNAIKALKNPLTANGAHKKHGLPDASKKRRKATGITKADFDKLFSVADEDTKSVMEIMSLTGCRPSEISSVTRLGFSSYRIESVKKDEKNSRGLDRTIQFDEYDIENIERLNRAVLLLQGSAKDSGISVSDLVGRVQRRFDKISVKTFPRRKLKICLYTLRHQHGSNLKASGLSRKEQAYLMGHRATKSLNRYGDVRKGSASAVAVKPGEPCEDLVRENHNDLDSARTHVKKRTQDLGLGR